MIAVLLIGLAAASPTDRPVPPHVTAARDAVDWQKAGDAAVFLLSDYLRVDTVNPPGNEARGVDFLGARLDAAGVPWTRLEQSPGRESLVARLEAPDPKGTLCLMSHVDVATSERELWTTDPLGGEIRDGQIWGRGALDMKGMGALELSVVELLVAHAVPLRWNVVLVAVSDEEVDNTGMKDLVANHWDQLGCTHMINEGGLGIRDALFDGETLHAISVAEKGILWTRLVATGEPGHGSTQEPDEAPAALLAAMARIDRKYRPKPTIDPALYEMLDAVGDHHGGIAGSVLGSRALVRLLVRGRLMSVPATRAAITNTVHLTGMRGAMEPNVVPSRVEAVYDCRLLRDTAPEDLEAELAHLLRKHPGVRWERIAADPANGSDWHGDPLYEAIAAYAVEGRPNAVAGPVISVGFTDSLYARPLGVQAFGYVPFEVTPDEAGTMHGNDERVSVDNVHEGLRRLFSIVVDVAGAP